jgi:RHS repeat-associated protein
MTPNGNLQSDGTRTYKYDYQNRLVEVKRSSDNTTIATYTYDLLGRRTRKVDTTRSSTASETILYIYSNENTIAEEKTIRSGTSSIVLNKIYINWLGTDNLIAYDTDERSISDYNLGKLSFCDSRVFPYESEFTTYTYTGITTDCSNLLISSSGTTHNRYYVHTNHQWSVIALSDSTGSVVQVYSYDSFWVPYIKSWSGISTAYTLVSSYTGSLHENSRLYTAREYDRETHLYFLRARYYSPSTGKFISRDPIWQNDQINLYTYVMNNPLMYIDLDWMKASAAIAENGRWMFLNLLSSFRTT